MPCIGALVGFSVEEIEGLGRFARIRYELDAGLDRRATGFQLVENAELLKGPVRLWHQRLADVEARKLLSFKEKNLVAICSEEGRYRGAGGTSAQHHDWAFRGEVSSVHQV